jgi:prepilin-type N-terminal cleavage/methylation domain-containing protein
MHIAAHRQNGFTLVEVMIAVMIIGLLAAMATPTVLKARDRAQRSVCQSNQRILEQAAETYALEKGLAPGLTLNDLQPYLARNQLPLCPAKGTYSLEISPAIRVPCSIAAHNP